MANNSSSTLEQNQNKEKEKKESNRLSGPITTSSDISHLIDLVKNCVREYMGRLDASHDYEHVQRVVELANIIKDSKSVISRVRYR